MKRPKLKKASKRVSCSKRYKIQKKVRDHNKKLRKVAKKKGVSRKTKKDPGVPNSAPFKEEVLREAEQRRLQLQELKEQNKLAKQKDRAEKRKKEKDTAGVDGPKAKKAKKLEAKRQEKAAIVKAKSAIGFRCGELKKVIEASDVVIEVLDARDPIGCRCPQLEEAVLTHEGKKKLMLVINKIDLVPKENLQKWLLHLQAELPTLAFKASTQQQDRTVEQKKRRVAEGAIDHSRAGASYGTDALLQILTNLANMQEDEKALKVGIVGFPNVGKSSLINTLKGMRACHAGLQRGMTRCMQEVHIAKNIKMLDSPGITTAPSNPPVAVALRSLQVEEEQASPCEAVRMLLKQCNQQQIMLQYNVPDYRNSLEFLTLFAKKRGLLQKGGEPSTEQAATAFLNDWTGAKLSYHSKPIEGRSRPPYLTDAIVTDMQKDIDMKALRKANETSLKRVRFANLTGSIVLTSKDLTNGILNASDIPEDTLAALEGAEEEGEEDEDVENTEEMNESQEVVAEDEEMTELPKPVDQEFTPEEIKSSTETKVLIHVPTVNMDLSSMQKNDDDAYDFNTDFV